MFVKRLALAGLVGFIPSLALPQGTAVLPQTAASSEQVDTSALAYYASKHDTVRLDAELRRLRSLYPNWQPPADPASLAVAPQGVSDDQPLWDLFGAEKLDELDAEIAKRKAANPAWNAPAELLTKLAAKRARGIVVAASDRKDYPVVIDIVSKTPDLVTPDDLDLSWRVADAYGQTGASDKALKIDQLILDHTQDPAARLATARKAMVALAPADLDKLLASGHTTPDGRSEFDAVNLDLVRQRVGRVLAANANGTVAPQDITRLESSAQGTNGAVDAALLGWWYSKRQDWAPASSWFQVALKAAPMPTQSKPEDAKVAQGAVLALRGLGRPADAEALAYSWREADPALALLYIGSVETDLTRPKPVSLEQDRLKRFSDVVLAVQSGNGAQALGWYAYNVGQMRPAEAWFRKAMAWQPRDTTALGLALSLKQIGDKQALATFLQDNGPTFPALAALSTDTRAAERPVLVARATQRLQAGRVRASRSGDRSAATLTVRQGPNSGCTASPIVGAYQGSPNASLEAGWCLMSLNRPQEAAAAFAAARSGADTRGDASYGQALAALRSKRTGVAVAAAGSVDLSAARRSEIGLAALAQTAAMAFDEGRYKDTLHALDQRRMYTPEPRDLAVLRAWSTYHTDHREQAQTLFKQLDTQLSTSETRAGVAATSESLRY